MALGGRNVGWDNTSPGSGDNAGLGDDEIRSLKTSMQSALDSEHDWAATGGANTGRHRPGAGRAYVDTQSRLSAGDVSGRLYIASDTSRAFFLGTTSSDITNYVGGRNVLEHAADPGGHKFLWAEEGGHAVVSSGVAAVSYSEKYSSPPTVVGSCLTTTSPGPVNVQFSQATTGGFVAQVRYSATSGEFASWGTLMWRSLGTRSL